MKLPRSQPSRESNEGQLAKSHPDRGRFSSAQWWRNGIIGGLFTTSHVHHFWRPSTSENNFLSPSLMEPVADARLCCARAPAHRHVAPRCPRSELFTWQRLRCPKGSCIGKRGEGRWWVRSPAISRTSFQRDKRIIERLAPEIWFRSNPHAEAVREAQESWSEPLPFSN